METQLQEDRLMNMSDNGIKFLKLFEGCRLTAYEDQAGVWTIGFGTIIYKDGTRVKEHDTITMDEANDLLLWQVGLKAAALNGLKINLNQNRFDALCDFAYNEGVGALTTLCKHIKPNPDDPAIEAQFLKWVYAAGKINAGLTARRKSEWKLYSKPI